MIVSVSGKRKDGFLSARGWLFWCLFWLTAAGAVWRPDATTMLAGLFGIGRGTDMVLYIALAVIFLVLFRLHIKLEKMSREITTIVREAAIFEANEKK